MGSLVTGKLVQDPETGYWREEAPPRTYSGIPDGSATFVLDAYRAGQTRAEITAALLPRASVKVQTLYRRVDQILLDAGIRERDDNGRATPNPGDGDPHLPAALRVFA